MLKSPVSGSNVGINTGYFQWVLYGKFHSSLLFLIKSINRYDD